MKAIINKIIEIYIILGIITVFSLLMGLMWFPILNNLIQKGIETMEKYNKNYGSMTEEENIIWDFILDECIATEEELQLVCKINGTSKKTFEQIIYCRTGFNTFEQIKEDRKYYQIINENIEYK